MAGQDQELWVSMLAETMKMVFEMPKLKYLKIPLFDGTGWMLNWSAINLPVNNSIEYLELEDIQGHEDILKVFVRSLRNLKHLKYAVVEDSTFRFLTEAAPNLISLKAGVFMATIETVLSGDFFPRMECFEVQAYHQSMNVFDWSHILTEETRSFRKLVAEAFHDENRRRMNRHADLFNY